MNPSQFVIQIVKEKYGEYLEMAGDNEPALLADILASLLHKQIQEKEYYKSLLREKEIKEKCG